MRHQQHKQMLLTNLFFPNRLSRNYRRPTLVPYQKRPYLPKNPIACPILILLSGNEQRIHLNSPPKHLQKEIDLKAALATIKTQNRLQEQRLRISRDLHDNVGSQLTFIISSLDNLKYVTKDTNTKLKEKLSNISSFTSDTIYQLRDTIWAMNKNEISIEDLHTRILSFIEKAKTEQLSIEQ
mgnify:CR=1 FL=1